jgi:hypothetical protein
MVEVTVEREKVGVEQARVEVERQSLANKQEFEDAALKFELEKFRIAAEKEIRIAAANAMGQMLAKAQMQIFGDPSTMAQMSDRFMRAASYGAAADGFFSNMPPQARQLLESIGTKLGIDLNGNGSGGGATNGHDEGAAAPATKSDQPAPVASAPGSKKSKPDA